MPSIFIWKSDECNESSEKIHCIMGSDWMLEEVGCIKRSYRWIDQEMLRIQGREILVFDAKEMPFDWVGSEIMEMVDVPYRLLLEEKGIMMEHIGTWIRFTLENEMVFMKESLEQEIGLLLHRYDAELQTRFSRDKKE